MQYFAKLTKYGSVNAKPVYFSCWPSRAQALSHSTKPLMPVRCSDAGMAHLEAMAREHYASFLYKQQNQDDIANNHITVSYWLYQDWGAHAKSFQLSHKYDFLKVRLCYVLFHKILLLNYSLYLCLPHYSLIIKNAIRRTTKSQMSGAANSSVQKKVLVPVYFQFNLQKCNRKVCEETMKAAGVGFARYCTFIVT